MRGLKIDKTANYRVAMLYPNNILVELTRVRGGSASNLYDYTSNIFIYCKITAIKSELIRELIK